MASDDQNEYVRSTLSGPVGKSTIQSSSGTMDIVLVRPSGRSRDHRRPVQEVALDRRDARRRYGRWWAWAVRGRWFRLIASSSGSTLQNGCQCSFASIPSRDGGNGVVERWACHVSLAGLRDSSARHERCGDPLLKWRKGMLRPDRLSYRPSGRSGGHSCGKTAPPPLRLAVGSDRPDSEKKGSSLAD